MNSAGEPFPHPGQPPDGRREAGPCDVCGVARLAWRKCKLVCEQCGHINKTCADL